MAEFIKDQPTSTGASAGDFFVFDTASSTYKITRQNLIGQMDTNQSDIAQNVNDIAANLSEIDTLKTDLQGIKVAAVHLDLNEILTLNTDPVVLVPVGSFQYIHVIDIYFQYIHQTIPFSTVGNLSVQSGGYAMGQIDSTIINQSSDMGGRLMPIVPTVITTPGDLTLSALGANPTNGNGALELSIIYKNVM